MKYCLVIIIWFAFFSVNAQKYDYNWILGYPAGPTSGNTKINFTESSADTTGLTLGIFMENSQTTVSDTAGNLIFFTNGARIYNRLDSTMLNGDSINYGPIWNLFQGYYYNGIQEIIALPTDSIPKWNLIHYYQMFNSDSIPYLIVWQLEQSQVNMLGDSGLGAVTLKNKILIQDTLEGYVTACQHANGRDWWVLESKSSTNCLYTLLVEPDTVIEYPLQCLGAVCKSSDAGQAIFSPDGTKFAWVGGYSGVNIYDFDRCTGLLSNPMHLAYPASGVSFSPNSGFLYITQVKNIMQFDMLDTNIAASVDTVGFYTAPPDSNTLPGDYFVMQLAPDGKIYTSTGNGTKYLHVINQPDKKGDSCNMVNYGFKLPYWNSPGLPSYPGNYRLGPLRGSPCDTIYTATTAIKAVNEKILKVYPNPATDYAIIDYGFTDWGQGGISMEITDAIGQIISIQKLPMYSGFQKLDISRFSSGMYTVAIKRNGSNVAVAKLVKQ